MYRFKDLLIVLKISILLIIAEDNLKAMEYSGNSAGQCF